MWTAADRGAASVWTAACAVLLCSLLVAVLVLGQAVVARHRAGGAADLAALAAADRALDGPGTACAAARRVAAANRAHLVRCRIRGEIADLTVRLRVGTFTPRARARAGPAGAAR